jgi:hypothetical protein
MDILNIGKYEFTSLEQANQKIDALGEHNHDIVFIPFDDEFIHVDVIWKNLDGHPHGWASYSVNFSEGEGIHTFAGLSFQQLKF